MNRKYNEELAMFDNSEVFHEFIKIAYDSGLSSYEEPDIGKEKDNEKAKLIEGLYSDEATEDQDKDGDELVEKAHKDKVEVLNSYLEDAGEYKNSVKTHKITENVATKGPEVNNIWHKNVTAIKNLMDELIVIAEEMEVRKQDDIVSFADNILERIDYTGDMVKEAAVPSKIPWKGILQFLAVVGAVGGAAYWGFSHADSGKVYSVNSACKIFIDGLKSYLSGKNIDKTVMMTLESIGRTVEQFRQKYYTLNGEYQSLISTIRNSEDKAEAKENLQKAKEKNKQIDALVEKALEILRNKAMELEGVKEEMKNKESEATSRTSSDIVWENVTGYYDAVTVTDEDLLVKNFTTLIASIEADKTNRTNNISRVEKTLSEPTLEPVKDEDTIEV